MTPGAAFWLIVPRMAAVVVAIMVAARRAIWLDLEPGGGEGLNPSQPRRNGPFRATEGTMSGARVRLTKQRLAQAMGGTAQRGASVALCAYVTRAFSTRDWVTEVRDLLGA